jgi:hypothetical protein
VEIGVMEIVEIGVRNRGQAAFLNKLHPCEAETLGGRAKNHEEIGVRQEWH